MNALILGKNAAAHVIAWKLAESRKTGELFCTSPYSGVDTLCTRIAEPSDTWLETHCPDLIAGAEETLYSADSACPDHGVRLTVDCLSDGHTIVPLPAVRIYCDASEQPMAAEAPADSFTADLAHYAYHQFFVPYVRNRGFSNRGVSGILRFEMVIADGKPVLRRVCRGMGELDAIAVIPLIRGELAKLLFACENGDLTGEMLRLNENRTAVVMLGAAEEGVQIEGLGDLPSEIGAFFGSVVCRDGKPFTAGPRPLFLCARCPDLPKARAAVLVAAERIRFRGLLRGQLKDE